VNIRKPLASATFDFRSQSKLMKTILCLLITGLALAGNALAQPFTLGSSQVQIVATPSVNHAPLGVPVTAPQGFDFGSLQVQSDSSWVKPTVNSTGSEIVLTFQTNSLVSQSYTATITASNGPDTVTFFVKATVSLLNVTKLVADPSRSRVYGVHQNGTAAGAVVIYDPLQETLVGSITVGRKPTDLAVSNDGTELFVINSVDRAITVVDLTTLRVKETIALSAFDNWGDADTSANIKVGAGNIIYYSDAAWAPALRVFDRSTRQVLQTMLIGSNGFGDFALSPDGKTLIGWAQYGWTAGWAGSYLARFSVSSTGSLTSIETTDQNYPTVLSRDPLDTPLFITNDNQLAFAKQLAVKAGSIKVTQQAFPTPIYSITPGGEVGITKTSVYETATGNKLVDLPVATAVQVVTPDYSRLAYFNPSQRAFGSFKLLEAIGDKILNQTLSPANGAIVLSPSSLRWQSVPGAQKYQVYLGTSQQDVSAATPTSPLLLGETTASFFPLNNKLTPGVTYFWRIDTVTSSGVTKGEVHNFTVSQISASLSQIDTATVQGHAHHTISIDLASDSSSLTWQASADVPWISFQPASGTTPSALQVVIDASHLVPGSYGGSVTITGSAGGPFVIPVRLRVDALHLTILKSNRASSIVYAISEDPAVPVGGAYLLEIDSATESILRVIRVGSSVTDLAVHLGDHKLYVPNWKGGSLLAIDQTTFDQMRTYNFSPFGGVGYSNNDVYRVTPGAAGRLIVEEEDQWIDVSLFDTQAGTASVKSFQRQGGGASDSTGRYYYHGDDNISDAKIHRFDLTGDKFTELVAARLNPLGYYGSRVVVVSENDSRIFWNGMVFDQALAPVQNLADLVYSTTTDGRYAFAEKLIYDTQTGQVVLGMPADTMVSAFNSSTGKLVVQVGSSVRFFPVRAPFTLATPALTVLANTDGSVLLTWTDNSLETGFTLQRRIAGSLSWEDVPVTIGRNQSSVTLRDLKPGTKYEFRIKADSPVTSSGWSAVTAVTSAGAAPVVLGNIATRMAVGNADNATIAGFIITGSAPVKVLIRGMGPTLGALGVPGTLTDPFLELHKPDQTIITNDNWADGDTSQIPAGFAPGSDKESVIAATLDPGNYTAILKGAHGETGVGLAEVYNLDSTVPAQLANISTRGFVQTGDNVMIGGFILGGSNGVSKVVVRAIGPSLTQSSGITNALANPTLELHDNNGALLASNDNWKINAQTGQSQEAQIRATTIQPTNDLESAIVATLPGGAYTAIVAGKDGGTGVALVEVYNMQ
jgi:hypothetical protein